MADLKDIIAKREELMKAWNTNYTDAMAEARRQVTASQAPTPVQPQPVSPQPIQPAPVEPQVVTPQPIQPASAPTQSTDWMGDFSQIKKREPVTPTAVTPEPVTPTPSPVTPEPVKTTVKPEAPVINRQQEIQNNLTTGYNTNPALFSDRNAFNQAYNYATKSPEEQATLDSFYNSKQPTISSMYSAIVNKQEVPDSTKMTPAYKIAQNRYSKASMYSSMTPTQVSEEMRNAKLVEGSQAFEDLKAINPKLVQDAKNLRKVNGDTTNIWTTNTDGTRVNNLERNIADDYTDNFGEFIKSMYKVYTPAEITAIIRTPDVVAAEDKALSIEKSINELDKQIANIDSDIDTEQKWGGATGSRIALEKASRRENLNKDRDSLVREYTTYANRASNLITQNTTSFQTQQQQQQAQNAAMLPFIQDQYKTAQAKKQAEFELNDPATQIKATMDEFAKLGIVAQGSLSQKVAEAKALIAKGGTLGEYINKLRSDFMEKPEYKKIQSLKAWELSDIQKLQATQNFALKTAEISNNFDLYKMQVANSIKSGSDITQNKIELMSKWMSPSQADAVIASATWNWKWVTGDWLLSVPDGAIIPTRLWQTTNNNGGKECAEYVNDAIWSRIFPSSLQGKLDVATNKTGKIWDAMVWKPSNDPRFAQYGHVWVIIWEQWDNWVVKSSNFNGDWRVSTDVVPKSDWLGYKTTNIWSKSTENKPLTDQQYTQYNQATSKFVADPNVKAFESALAGGGDLIASLKSANWPGDVGAVFWFMKSLDPASVVKEWEFALAAKSAWVWESFKNIPANKLEGTILTDKQRKDFGKLAFEYIKSKGKLYDIKYDDYIKVLKNQWIPESFYPTKMTDTIGQFQGWSSNKLSALSEILAKIAQNAPKR